MEENKGILYLIPTPIGNLEDITLRSLNTLKTVDLILCEDTRETIKLLNHYGIKKRMISNHKYNEKQNFDKILSYLNRGYKIGLVSDRGTPIISDPGWETVSEIIKLGFKVIALPGPTALISALIISTFQPTPFVFYGFLNNKEEKRKKELEKLKLLPYTLIFYESPHRIEKTLNNILEIFGDRLINISREISKQYEQSITDKISKIMLQKELFKGEIVIVVEGNKMEKEYTSEEIIKYVNYYIESGKDLKTSIKEVSKQLKVNKNEVYKQYHNL